MALYLAAQSPQSISGAYLGAMLGVSRRGRARLIRWVWERMASLRGDDPFGGPGVHVEVDEMYLKTGVRLRSTKAYPGIFGITDRKRYRTFFVPNRRRETLFPLVEKHVLPGSVINTDDYNVYRGLDALGFEHIKVNHSQGYFVGFEGATTVWLDGYWGQIKHAMRRVHHSVTEKHIPLFLRTLDYHYSMRNDRSRMLHELLGGWPHEDLILEASEEVIDGYDRYHAKPATRPSYVSKIAEFSDEAAAYKQIFDLGINALECPRCRVSGCFRSHRGNRRVYCSRCGWRKAVLSQTIARSSKVPLSNWLSLCWLFFDGSHGLSISYTSSLLGVSRPAAISMLSRLRDAVARSMSGFVVGGVGQVVHYRVASFRVLSSLSTGRKRLRQNVVIACCDGAVVCGLIPKRSQRYIYLWARKHIAAGSCISHPDTIPFGEMSEAWWTQRIESEEESYRSPCNGYLASIRGNLRFSHLQVRQSRLDAFVQEQVFRLNSHVFTYDDFIERIFLDPGFDIDDS